MSIISSFPRNITTITPFGEAAVSPSTNGNITLAGAGGISFVSSPANNSITITGSSIPGGLTWMTSSGGTLTTSGGWFISAATASFFLPVTPPMGTTLQFFQVISGPGTITITAGSNSEQFIIGFVATMGTVGPAHAATTTAGVGAYLSLIYDAAATTWCGTASNGTWDVT